MSLGLSILWIAIVTLILAQKFFDDKGDNNK